MVEIRRTRIRDAEDASQCGTVSDKTQQGTHTKAKPPTHDAGRVRWEDVESQDMKFMACFGKASSISAVPAQEHEGWRRVGITVDSGAADSVADPRAFPGYEVRKRLSPVFYQSATGEPITNVGEQQIALLTNEGTLRGMTFQATERVRKPLAAVKRIVEAGHAVVFAPEELGGSFILNLESGEENGLREDDGNYMLDVWVPPASALGFPRHP